MLNNVPKAVAAANRQVVLRHPNSWPVSVWRKKVLRTDAADPASTMGGSPTMGGMGVLKADDEAEIAFEELGEARMLFCGIHRPLDINERQDAIMQEPMQDAQVVSVAGAQDAGYFEITTGDLILQDLLFGVVLAYDVAAVTGSVNIPPYVRKAVIQPRDDLSSLEPFTTLDA
jgi:hypothetical protein